MRHLSKVGKWTLRLAGLLGALFLLAWVLLQRPAVQQWAVDKIATDLSRTWGAKVAIDKVNIRFFKTLALEGIYLEDLSQDTLLYADKLTASISLFSFLKKQLHVQGIGLSDAVCKVKRTSADSTYNFSFLLGQADKTSTSNGTGTYWDIDLKQLNFTNVRFLLDDQLTDLQGAFLLDDLAIEIQDLDLVEQKVVVKQVSLSQSSGSLHTTQQKAGKQPGLRSDREEEAFLVWPNLPWEIEIQQVRLSDNRFTYQQRSTDSNAQTLLTDIQLEQFGAQFEAIHWHEKEGQLSLSHLSFLEKSGFELEHLWGNVELSETGIQLENWDLKTPNSHIGLAAKLDFPAAGMRWDNWQETRVEGKVIPTEIAVSEVEGIWPLISQWLRTDVEGVIIDLSGELGGTLGDLALKQARVGIGNQLSLDAQLSAQKWWSPQSAVLNLQGISLQTSYESLETVLKRELLPTGLKDLGRIRLSMAGKGSWDDFRLGRLQLSTSSGTELLASGRIKNKERWENSQFELAVNSLSTTALQWRGFSPNLPPLLDSIGTIQLKADGRGTLGDFTVAVLAEGGWGQLECDAAMQLGQDSSTATATYQLDAVLRPLEIGPLLGMNELGGPLLVALDAEGRGFSWPDLTASFKTQINNLTYKGYAYPTINYKGKLEEGLLANHLSAANDDVDIDAKSNVALNDSLLAVDFEVAIKQLSTQALRLTDSILVVQLNANGRVEGNTLDELIGEVVLSDIYLANDSLDYRSDKVNLISERVGAKNRKIALFADFLEASIEGDFEPSRLGDLFLGLFDHHFDLEALLDTQWVATLDSLDYNPALRDQRLEARLHLKEAKPLQILALPALRRLDQAQLNLKVDHTRQQLAFTASVDSLSYANLNIDQAQLAMNGNRQKMDGQALLRLARDGGAGLESIKLNTNWQNDSLLLSLNVVDTLAAQKLAIGGRLTQRDQEFLLKLNPDLVLNGKSWLVAPDHWVHLKRDWFSIDGLRLQKEAQALRIQSESQARSSSIAPLKLTFEKFELSELSDLFRFPDSLINGQVDGYADIYDLDQKAYFTADIKIPDLLWHKQQLGALQLTAEQNLSHSAIQMEMGLTGQQNQLNVSGSYQTQTQELDVKTVIDQLNLRFLNPITEGVLSSNEGSMSGEIALTGTLSDPRVGGRIVVDTFSTKVPFAQSNFRIPSVTLQIDNRALQLETTTIRDDLGNTATLTGEIRHRKFSDFQLDLKVLTDRFRFLNTTVVDNELLYGQLMLRSDIAVTGPLSAPRLDINATSLSPSTFNLSPFSLQEGIVQEDEFVIFGKPAELEKSKETEAFYAVKNDFPFDIRVNLDLSDNAEFKFIIDPVSGDKLVARGFANLVLRMTPNGAIRLNGIYTVSSGTYSFSYGQLLRRAFDIRKGGRVTFNGNPLDAKFDLAAAYTLRTSTYPLIDSDSQLDALEEAQSKERSPLDVVLNLSGDLNQPALQFGIELPQENGDLLSSRVQRRLELLNKSPNELNRQVFSLLLFQHFIQANQQFSFNVAETGEKVAYSSVASLFTSQLNKLAENYVKGVEINFDIDAYKEDYGSDNSDLVTQLDVDLSKQFFNNRLKIQAGTNVDLRNNGSQSNLNTLSGDYVVEYKLTKKGNYLIRVFRKDEFDILLDENTAKTGFSIFFKKAFDSKQRKKS